MWGYIRDIVFLLIYIVVEDRGFDCKGIGSKKSRLFLNRSMVLS